MPQSPCVRGLSREKPQNSELMQMLDEFAGCVRVDLLSCKVDLLLEQYAQNMYQNAVSLNQFSL